MSCPRSVLDRDRAGVADVAGGTPDPQVGPAGIHLPARRPAFLRRVAFDAGEAREARFDRRPVGLARVPVGEASIVELEDDVGAFTWIQADLGEVLPLLGRPGETGVLRCDVALDHL